MLTRPAGFTIVELLLTTVVIAILAAIGFVAFNGVKARASESLVKADLQYNIKRVLLYQAEYGALPSTLDLTTANSISSGYKFKVSKRSSYQYLGYCTGGPAPIKEVIITAGMPGKKQFYYSTLANAVTDVSAIYDTASAYGTSYKCYDFLQNPTSRIEFRDMIHLDGGVETGYVDVLAQ